MQSAAQRAREPVDDSLIELPPYARLPRLDLAIEWESAGQEFRTSVRDFFAGPRPAKEAGAGSERVLRAEWIQGRVPGRAMVASCLWHVAAVWILILPIWGFLPSARPTLAPVQIELTWYAEPADLPAVLAPAVRAKPSRPLVKTGNTVKLPAESRSARADAYHPRQTILSIPVRVTHPRQTLLQPSAPPAPPKIAPALPNIVRWAANEAPRLRMPLSQTTSAPIIRPRAARDVAAPEIANPAKNSRPLNLVAAPDPKLKPPMLANTMAPPQRRPEHADAGTAPELGTPTGERNPSLPRLIALSATPAPPAPIVRVPEGNLAARISISPEGPKSAAAGGPSATNGTTSPGGKSSAAGAAGGGAESLPAAVSVSGGNSRASRGGIVPAGRMILQPAPPASVSRRGPVDVSRFDPGLPPEKILSSSEVYTLHINLPNLTSASGSWILSFAQLDEDNRNPWRPRGELSGPVPIEKADPEYPPDMIREHVTGEVVLYAIIRKDGSVDSIQVVRGLEPELDRNAIRALAQWKFRPGRRAGVAVDLEAVVHIPFNYRNPRQ